MEKAVGGNGGAQKGKKGEETEGGSGRSDRRRRELAVNEPELADLDAEARWRFSGASAHNHCALYAGLNCPSGLLN